jgi:uncharacterized protein YqeY
MSLKEKISADLKEAMKARDQLAIDTLRSAMSALTYKKVETGKDLSSEEEIAVIQKQVKQRTESIAEYTKAGRADSAANETREKEILAKYLPAQKSTDEIRKVVLEILESIPKEDRNQGAAMKAIMPKLKGLADGNLVKQIVTEELQKG